jgi:hypothetical protein
MANYQKNFGMGQLCFASVNLWEGAMLIQVATFIVFAKNSRRYVYSRGYVYSGL